MKEKAKTIAERFGFKDKDLTTPEHDKILLWLLKDENLIKVLEKLGIIKKIDGINRIIDCPHWAPYNKCDWSWDSMSCSGVCEYDVKEREKKSKEVQQAVPEIDSFIREICPKYYPTLIKLEKKAEVPIKSERYTIGFVDLCVNIKTEFRVNNFFSVEFYKKSEDQVYIEIKPRINSVGELIRQINFYRSYLHGHTRFILITKTVGFKPILASQDIWVYEVGEECDKL